MRNKLFALLMIFAMLLVLAGCGKDKASHETQDAAATEAILETTEATIPPTVPDDGNADDVTCKGTYTAEQAVHADQVIATQGEAELTNRQLQLYYWLEVARYCEGDYEQKPDLTQGLDTQVCPIDDSVNSWQQYFLRNALNTWHTHQALNRHAAEVPMPTEDAYNPIEGNHEKYMTDIPATKYLYGFNPQFRPNDMHQEWLDAIPEWLEGVAADAGYGTVDALAAAVSGDLADGEDLTRLVTEMNYAYTYFTEKAYTVEPTAEDFAAYAEAENIPDDGNVRVDLRHVLLIPEGAQLAADGTVSCSEADWDACMAAAQELLAAWQSGEATEPRFGELANEHSADLGSSRNGGLYVMLEKGQLMQELDAWCFDAARQIGDTGIVRTAAGVHILYCSDIVTGQLAAAEAAYLRSHVDAIAEEIRAAYPVEIQYDAILLGTGSGEAVSTADLLYPDIAHERYPSVPLYLQQDFYGTMYGKYPIHSYGCGITTFSMITSYFTDNEWTPAEMCALYGDYCLPGGTNAELFMREPAAMGYYLDFRSSNWPEVMEYLKEGRVTVSLQYRGYWTKGGHYLALQEINEDGLVVVRDSNLFNYGRLRGHKIDAFSPDLIPNFAGLLWVYEEKFVVSPICVRCGEADTQQTPQVMFLEDYHCAKCRTAMNRRDSFLGE